MGWTYFDVLALPDDIYIEAVAYVNTEVNAPQT